jgi:hypothetical protein
MKAPGQLAQLVTSILDQAGSGMRKDVLMAKVEQAIGRPLTEYEKGLGLWRGREDFLNQHRTEIKSVRGVLSLATPLQSIQRRKKEQATAVRRLARSACRARELSRNATLAPEEAATLGALAERATEMQIRAQSEQRKHLKKMPPGLE